MKRISNSAISVALIFLVALASAVLIGMPTSKKTDALLSGKSATAPIPLAEVIQASQLSFKYDDINAIELSPQVIIKEAQSGLSIKDFAKITQLVSNGLKIELPAEATSAAPTSDPAPMNLATNNGEKFLLSLSGTLSQIDPKTNATTPLIDLKSQGTIYLTDLLGQGKRVPYAAIQGSENAETLYIMFPSSDAADSDKSSSLKLYLERVADAGTSTGTSSRTRKGQSAVSQALVASPTIAVELVFQPQKAIQTATAIDDCIPPGDCSSSAGSSSSGSSSAGPTATPIETGSPSASPSPSPSETISPSPTATGSVSPSPTASETPTGTATPSITPSQTASHTPTITATATHTSSPTTTPSSTPSETPTYTPTYTPSYTPTPVPTYTATTPPTATPTYTYTYTPTPTPTPTGCYRKDVSHPTHGKKGPPTCDTQEGICCKDNASPGSGGGFEWRCMLFQSVDQSIPGQIGACVNKCSDENTSSHGKTGAPYCPKPTDVCCQQGIPDYEAGIRYRWTCLSPDTVDRSLPGNNTPGVRPVCGPQCDKAKQNMLGLAGACENDTMACCGISCSEKYSCVPKGTGLDPNSSGCDNGNTAPNCLPYSTPTPTPTATPTPTPTPCESCQEDQNCSDPDVIKAQYRTEAWGERSILPVNDALVTSKKQCCGSSGQPACNLPKTCQPVCKSSKFKTSPELWKYPVYPPGSNITKELEKYKAKDISTCPAPFADNLLDQSIGKIYNLIIDALALTPDNSWASRANSIRTQATKIVSDTDAQLSRFPGKPTEHVANFYKSIVAGLNQVTSELSPGAVASNWNRITNGASGTYSPEQLGLQQDFISSQSTIEKIQSGSAWAACGAPISSKYQGVWFIQANGDRHFNAFNGTFFQRYSRGKALSEIVKKPDGTVDIYYCKGDPSGLARVSGTLDNRGQIQPRVVTYDDGKGTQMAALNAMVTEVTQTNPELLQYRVQTGPICQAIKRCLQAAPGNARAKECKNAYDVADFMGQQLTNSVAGDAILTLVGVQYKQYLPAAISTWLVDSFNVEDNVRDGDPNFNCSGTELYLDTKLSNGAPTLRLQIPDITGARWVIQGQVRATSKFPNGYPIPPMFKGLKLGASFVSEFPIRVAADGTILSYRLMPNTVTPPSNLQGFTPPSRTKEYLLSTIPSTATSANRVLFQRRVSTTARGFAVDYVTVFLARTTQGFSQNLIDNAKMRLTSVNTTPTFWSLLGQEIAGTYVIGTALEGLGFLGSKLWFGAQFGLSVYFTFDDLYAVYNRAYEYRLFNHGHAYILAELRNPNRFTPSMISIVDNFVRENVYLTCTETGNNPSDCQQIAIAEKISDDDRVAWLKTEAGEFGRYYGRWAQRSTGIESIAYSGTSFVYSLGRGATESLPAMGLFAGAGMVGSRVGGAVISRSIASSKLVGPNLPFSAQAAAGLMKATQVSTSAYFSTTIGVNLVNNIGELQDALFNGRFHEVPILTSHVLMDLAFSYYMAMDTYRGARLGVVARANKYRKPDPVENTGKTEQPNENPIKEQLLAPTEKVAKKKREANPSKEQADKFKEYHIQKRTTLAELAQDANAPSFPEGRLLEEKISDFNLFKALEKGWAKLKEGRYSESDLKSDPQYGEAQRTPENFEGPIDPSKVGFQYSNGDRSYLLINFVWKSPGKFKAPVPTELLSKLGAKLPPNATEVTLEYCADYKTRVHTPLDGLPPGGHTANLHWIGEIELKSLEITFLNGKNRTKKPITDFIQDRAQECDFVSDVTGIKYDYGRTKKDRTMNYTENGYIETAKVDNATLVIIKMIKDLFVEPWNKWNDDPDASIESEPKHVRDQPDAPAAYREAEAILESNHLIHKSPPPAECLGLTNKPVCPVAETQPKLDEAQSFDNASKTIRTRILPEKDMPDLNRYIVMYIGLDPEQARAEIQRQQALINQLAIQNLFDPLVEVKNYEQCFTNKSAVYGTYQARGKAGSLWLNTDKINRTTETSLTLLLNFLKPLGGSGTSASQAYWIEPRFEIDLSSGALIGLNPQNIGISGKPGPDGKIWSAEQARVYMLNIYRELMEALLSARTSN